jgi:hypothetical protein
MSATRYIISSVLVAARMRCGTDGVALVRARLAGRHPVRLRG